MAVDGVRDSRGALTGSSSDGPRSLVGALGLGLLSTSGSARPCEGLCYGQLWAI